MSKYKNVAIYKAWAMPNAETFTIIPIKKFIESKVSSFLTLPIRPASYRNPTPS